MTTWSKLWLWQHARFAMMKAISKLMSTNVRSVCCISYLWIWIIDWRSFSASRSFSRTYSNGMVKTLLQTMKGYFKSFPITWVTNASSSFNSFFHLQQPLIATQITTTIVIIILSQSTMLLTTGQWTATWSHRICKYTQLSNKQFEGVSISKVFIEFCGKAFGELGGTRFRRGSKCTAVHGKECDQSNRESSRIQFCSYPVSQRSQ